MHPPPETRPRHRRHSVRRQARLDAETHAKLAALTRTFHRTRAQILRSVMHWGLAHTQPWTVDLSIPERPYLVPLLVAPELLPQVQAADAHGASVAAWLRHAMRQVTCDDFPPSWRAGETATRSHESGSDRQRFMRRLDEASSAKLERLAQHFGTSAAEVIRQLIAQATPEEFPPSWHMSVEERCQQGTSAGRGRSIHGRRQGGT
jgi:predicted DNA-binding protein